MPVAPDGTAYDLNGPVGTPCVVLVHGLGLNRDCWQWTVPALSDAYRTLSYDLFGHGRSVPPPDTPTLSLFSRQLQGLLDHVEIDAAVIAGFSLGGMIARRFVQDMPGRGRALVVLHSPHKRSDAAQSAILARVAQARDGGPEATVEAALERWFSPSFLKKNPDIMMLVRKWVLANKKEIYHTIYNVLADGMDEIVRPNPPISCPALVISSDEDYGNGPEMAWAIAAEIDGAETLILKGLRHMALVESPEAINLPVRRFLDGLKSEHDR